MKIYRIAKEKHIDDLSGDGASKQKENRWNPFGISMLYTSESRALSALELSKYVNPYISIPDYSIAEIEIPDNPKLILSLDEEFYKDDWTNKPALTQEVGEYFVNQNQHLALKVPSVWMYECHNYLLNPNHEEFHNVKILNVKPFPFKGKLFE